MERADYKREERQKESLRTSDFAFDLPKELIAQDPLQTEAPPVFWWWIKIRGKQDMRCLGIFWIICTPATVWC